MTCDDVAHAPSRATSSPEDHLLPFPSITPGRLIFASGSSGSTRPVGWTSRFTKSKFRTLSHAPRFCGAHLDPLQVNGASADRFAHLDAIAFKHTQTHDPQAQQEPARALAIACLWCGHRWWWADAGGQDGTWPTKSPGSAWARPQPTLRSRAQGSLLREVSAEATSGKDHWALLREVFAWKDQTRAVSGFAKHAPANSRNPPFFSYTTPCTAPLLNKSCFTLASGARGNCCDPACPRVLKLQPC